MVGFCGAESDFGCRKKTHGSRGRELENRLTSLDKGRLADPVVIFCGGDQPVLCVVSEHA